VNIEKYIGIEFEDNGRGGKFDCWGLAMYFLKEEFGFDLPDLSEQYFNSNDRFNIPFVVDLEKPNWLLVSKPNPGNVVLFNISGIPMHVGIVVSDTEMLHIAKGINSCIESFTSMKWKNRVEGFYAYSKH
jgi:cell wall-associated NlpC family hydrolase